MVPYRQIRAQHDGETITVYQAYRAEIAEPAVREQRFVEPFSFNRMTWIKPSFLWMMGRCGWATKPGQEHVLAVRISREGFDEALGRAVLTHPSGEAAEDWQQRLKRAPVRVQWDPERSLRGGKLEHRSIQIGIGRALIRDYAEGWIRAIEDVTPLVRRMRAKLGTGDVAGARRLLPPERPYPVATEVARRLGMD